LFQNLISNALKFTKQGIAPQITIKAELINFPTIESPSVENGFYCRISVSDNGIGFEEKYADKIFTIFQRLNGVSEYEGTGIGLAIARKIIDQHNGLIMAKSTPDRGSTFYIILPVRHEELHKITEVLPTAKKEPNHT
jgi:signal transduction histidine kinase